MGEKQRIELTIVVSVYNEADGLPHFWSELKGELNRLRKSVEVIFVNDGSTDRSRDALNAIEDDDNYVRIIEFSKNYGHEAAMIAGIDLSFGQYVICMDSDLQHPPRLIHQLIEQAELGADVVLTERMSRADSGFAKKLLSQMFYWFIRKLSSYPLQPSSTDFFLVTRQVVDILKTHFRDRNRFIRGFIQSIGFEKAIVPFNAPPREFGRSSYSFNDLIALATTAIFSYSNKPLRISMLISFLFILFTISLGAYSIYQFMSGSTPPSGYTTIVIFLSASFGALFGVIAILSMYFEKSLEEQRGRPIYLVKEVKKGGKPSLEETSQRP